MSTGHHHYHGSSSDSVVINRLLENQEILDHLNKPDKINRDYDLPYLGGYSKNGETIYIDRHLPDTLYVDVNGRKRSFDPILFVSAHEAFEKAVIDVLDWEYYHAHQAATSYERRFVLKSGLFWASYQKEIAKFVKVDEHEKLKKVPADLDMRPYYAKPVNRALIAHMEKAMGGKMATKKIKAEVSYSEKGDPTTHCGPVRVWPRGECAHFESPAACELVRGYITPKGWCRLWKGLFSDDNKDKAAG